MIEVHHEPERALSDGMQSLYPEQFEELCAQIEPIYRIFKTSSNGCGAGGEPALGTVKGTIDGA